MIVDLRKAGTICAAVIILMISLNIIAGGCSDKSSHKNLITKDEISPSETNAETDDQQGKSQAKYDFFSEYRLERERIRSKEIEMLREIINNSTNEKEVRQAALLRLVQITEDMEKEMKAENLVKSKGFEECVVIIHPQSITVVVEENSLRLDKEEEIKELVSRAIQCNEDNLSIIVREPGI